jgi:putative DNA methylase
VSDDRRIIEDLIPVDAINETSSREKQGARLGHPSSLHQWWARRPLAAARAAVYATLVPVDGTRPEARSADYFRELCRWGASENAIRDARNRVLAANGGVPPHVLDLFAGGGAIPLEAARLGCDATAVELNPVAHLIEKCMLEYPQRFGPSLADDIRVWGERWVARAWDRVGHLYPPAREVREDGALFGGSAGSSAAARAAGRPTAYLWTRTVQCPNLALDSHAAPLVRQTWLARKNRQYVALQPIVNRDALSVRWKVVEADSPENLGFDPAGFSKASAATCLVCGATADANYVRGEGRAGRLGIMPLAAVMVKASGRGRDYLAVGDFPLPANAACADVIAELDIAPPNEPIPPTGNAGLATGTVYLYGLSHFRDLFTPRQLATLCAFAQGVREIHQAMMDAGMEAERAEAVTAHLALVVDRTADLCSSLCRWVPQGGFTANTYARQALQMVWDFSEINPFGEASGDVIANIERAARVVEGVALPHGATSCIRTSATNVPLPERSIDAVITDPPYYDNISYADLSDFFYVWLKRSVGFLFSDHLGGKLTPKRHEAIVAPYRHDGDKTAAREFYEHEMASAFAEAHRVLKPGAPLVCVYAHKTTLGWSSLVESLRRAQFSVTEAWPLDTEMPERVVGQGTSSLASSIFLVARRRDGNEVGEVALVRGELDSVIDERLDTLTAAGVAGSDLIIATIGAALQPFTRYASVELPNGEELPTTAFLEEVQSRVLAAVLRKVHGLGNGVGTIDPATRYYVLSRYSYGYGKVDFDEANNLARTAGLELDDLRHGPVPLATIAKGTVELHDFQTRGEHEHLGLPDGTGSVHLIDILQGLLWRASHRTGALRSYLDETHPDPHRLRAVAQALQGPALRTESESKSAEAQACERLLGAWRTLVDDNLLRSV